MAFIKKLELANYTLTFDDKKVLIDFFYEIVMPSFEDSKYKRLIKGGGEFFFLDTQLVILDANSKNPQLAIAGRFVKNMLLKSEQKLSKNGKLISDKQELETAPTSLFTLILNNHRLIFCREMGYAPTLTDFLRTSAHFLKLSYKDYFNKKVKELEDKEENVNIEVAKIELRKEIPSPTLRITTLSDSSTLKEYINNFATIKKVNIKLLQTNNDEIDLDDFFNKFKEQKEKTNSSYAKIEYSNSKDGLDYNAPICQYQ